MNKFLLIGGICSLVAALLHVGCIVYGASWYRFFGAGERMVNLSNKGSVIPTIITLHITVILTLFGAFTIYSASYMPSHLAMNLQALLLITAIYLIRGAFGFLFILKPLGRTRGFWGWSSCVCLIIGIIHYFGVFNFHPYV